MAHVTEQEARQVAEASRQTEWRQPSFLRELFLGSFRPDLIPDYPRPENERKEFRELFAKLRSFFVERVNPVEIDETGEYPDDVVEALQRMGAFGLLVPSEYGGHGLNKTEWCKLMELLGSYEGNILGLLSPHQSVGVPETVKQFGTPEQKKKYLTRCAAGEISAFALTEVDVGSDPARLATTAELTPEGDAYILNGTKLWCTNGTMAKLLIVMARDPKTRKISAFIVETDWPGIEVVHRCRFMGLKALANGVIRFSNVRVPKENLVGEEGKGLKLALTVLNVGRLSVPAGAVGTAKKCLEICRVWAKQRVQWGKPLGEHEAIAHMIADMASVSFAMESIAYMASEMAVKGGYDIRLEAAAAKEWNTCRCWEIIDNTMQIRGGRGYETERSLHQRGEMPMGVERMMRDYRVAKIFEGASEIMHLFMAREAVDKHLQVAGVMLDNAKSTGAKLAALPGIMAFYAMWYPRLWFFWKGWGGFGEYGELAGHLRFVERNSRKLAREIFHGMLIYKARLERKQAFLFRLVDVANELFAMTTVCLRARQMALHADKDAESAVKLADVFCKSARLKVNRLFVDLWSNADDARYDAGKRVLDGEFAWLEEGIVRMDETDARDLFGETRHESRETVSIAK